MARLIIAILATILLVAFAMANTHHVELSLVFGKPTEIRAITLLGAAYGAGVLTAVIGDMVLRLKRAEGRKVRLSAEESHALARMDEPR
jgi:uncharacterized integral membrane protein